ncbi:cytochrome P450 [Gautieria morchelliformis]|nr:cytochrome P450 [Gautieria morchelliformis]
MLSQNYILLDFAIASCALLLCHLYYTRKQNTRPPFPPGPKPLPIIGNMKDLQNSKIWETYNHWAEEYGDVVHVSSFGSHIIILNSFKAVYDLLERRSSIYSSRPHLTMFHDLMDTGGSTVWQPYGKTWRKHRSLYHKQMNQIAAKEFQPSQLAAARGLLRLLVESPEDYLQHIRHMAAGIVMGIAYGREVSPKGDPFVALSESNAREFARALRPGAFLVDIFPILKYVPAWVPGAGFQKHAREARQNFHNAMNVPFREVKSLVSAGTARPSFVANALGDLGTDDESNEDVDAVKRVAGGIFGAGSDTTTSTVHAFILAMVLHPDVQARAQTELDSVIEQGQLPRFSDRPFLPYLDAIVKEVFRWFLVAPTALPHVTTEDDVYEGYSIPANSTVIPNSWRILNNPEMYPNPSAFLPERFLPDKNGHVARDPATTGTFGFGRRICAGRHLADASVWLAAASLLSVFNITNALDEYGRKIDVSYARDPTPGFLSHPRPFKCSITPRSKDVETMIRRTTQL